MSIVEIGAPIWFSIGYMNVALVHGHSRKEFPSLEIGAGDKAFFLFLGLLGPVGTPAPLVFCIAQRHAPDLDWPLRFWARGSHTNADKGGEAARIAALFTVPEDWDRKGEHLIAHRSGLEVWISSGARYVSLYPNGFMSPARRALGYAGNKKIWRAYKQWLVWINAQPIASTALGTRVWLWNGKYLVSPYMGTAWTDPELHCTKWDTSEVVRGNAGIHAERLTHAWKWKRPYVSETASGTFLVRGIVERFGHYVLGSDGWRAEWVIIRKLLAPNDEIGLALEKAYPDVEIVYEHR